MNVDKCHHYSIHHVVKYGFTKITLVFKEIGKTNVKVQDYICKRYGKTFQTDKQVLLIKQ